MDNEKIWEICGEIVTTIPLMRQHNAIALPEAAKLAAVELFKKYETATDRAIALRYYLKTVQ